MFYCLSGHWKVWREDWTSYVLREFHSKWKCCCRNWSLSAGLWKTLASLQRMCSVFDCSEACNTPISSRVSEHSHWRFVALIFGALTRNVLIGAYVVPICVCVYVCVCVYGRVSAVPMSFIRSTRQSVVRTFRETYWNSSKSSGRVLWYCLRLHRQTDRIVLLGDPGGAKWSKRFFSFKFVFLCIIV